MSYVPEILSLLRERASRRAIDPAPLGEEDLLALLEAARWAPSWGNGQPWRFVLVRSAQARAAIAAGLSRGNAWAANAPAFIVLAADPADGKERDGQPYYLFDCGLAVLSLIVEATQRGLVAHPIAGWDQSVIHSAINAPENTRVVVVIVVGKPGNIEMLDESTREKERRPRSRKSLAEIAFDEHWGNVLPFLPEAKQLDP